MLKAIEMSYKFTDPDGELLEVGFNYSFGYPSITLYAEEGVRMNVVETEKLISVLTELVEEAKAKTNS